MCGIIAGLSLKNKQIVDILLSGLKQLQNRGYDSAGICTMNGKFSIIKYATTNEMDSINRLIKEKDKLNQGQIGIAHTRWATHGGKTDINSHPHLSYDNKIVIVHNGIIENYKELKKMLIEKDIEFKSQTDTEVISNLLAYNYNLIRNNEYQENNEDSDEKIKERDIFVYSIKKTIEMLRGTWGLAIMNLDDKNRLYCVRHGSPILVSKNDDMVLIASEQSGFNGITNNYFTLNSNDVCIIEKELDKISIKTECKYKYIKSLNKNFDLTPDPYPHWTIKEIKEQYHSSMRAISLGGRLVDNNKVRLGGLTEHKEVLKRIDNLIFLGCGTSYYAAMCGINYFKELCNFNVVQLIDGAEFNVLDIPKVGNTALVLLSQSGETKDLHRCIKIGNDYDLFMIGIINVVDSMIAREVNCGCYLNAGREVGVASTKSFTSQVILLSLLAVWFSQIHDKNNIKRMKYVKSLRILPYNIKKSISIVEKKKELLINILNKKSLFVLGKGKGEAIAKEGALKIKEITYIHAEGYSGSALKHGPFALLDENIPVILIAPYNEHYIKMCNAYEQIKSRNAPILFITDNPNCEYDNCIILPINKVFSELLSVIPLQLAAYYISIYKGINPDMPRNLAKCVTVE